MLYMSKNYANERSVLILVALLKEHNIKKVIASPGTTNLTFVASLQCDPFFEVYSCVDERSAAYMACGLSAETGEPVVITCTGATASRNYPSGLTEAYYRKLPILAVTGSKNENRIGHLESQLIDRRVIPNDVIKYSVNIPTTKDDQDAYFNELKINMAINALFTNGGGPVHINLETQYTRDFSVKNLPKVHKILSLSYNDIDRFPQLPKGKIGIFVGSHPTFTSELNEAIDKFCEAYDAVVFCDNTSGYYGKYRFNYGLLGAQQRAGYNDIKVLDLCIHIGEVSAEYSAIGNLLKKDVWRVSTDGEIRDTFKRISYAFKMEEADFFRYYTPENYESKDSYISRCKILDSELRKRLPDIPFSNVWIASKLYDKIPYGSCIHFGVLNSIRSWNMFQLPDNVTTFANVGGFGIDGGVSSLIGASLANPNKLYFGVFGDLAFFYDMNSVGNRHVGNNVRILIVNNGRGQEFRNHYHMGAMFGDDADKYIAAAGHFGNQSHTLVKDLAQNLGFEYFSASNKEEFEDVYSQFISPSMQKKPVIFECFTETHDESNATEAYWNTGYDIKNAAIVSAIKLFGGKQTIKKIVGKAGIKFFKNILNKKI